MLPSALLGVLALLPGAVQACSVLNIRSPLQPFLNDQYVLTSYIQDRVDAPIFQHNLRPIYVSSSDGPARYLYHIQVGEDLGGRWLLGGEVGVNSAWAFVQSWAVAPHLVSRVSDRAVWRVYQQEEEDSEEGPWLDDHGLTIECEGWDTSIFVVSPLTPGLGGFYTETAETSLDRSVYVSPNGLYLYATGRNDGGSLWILGEEPGTISGLAYVGADTENPHVIKKEEGAEWNVAVDGVWHTDPAFMVISTDREACMEALKPGWKGAKPGVLNETCSNLHTTWDIVKEVRMGQKPKSHTATLNNGIHIPLVGYGTGAMPAEDVQAAVTLALDSGYRLLDTASAYGNEETIGEILRRKKGPSRDEVVIMSKLWFSELGFDETVEAAKRSLTRLQTDYLDAYLIHWPQCYPEIEWMDCSEQSDGTWQQSWRALEKLYAEGFTLAIGVSNFDDVLMEELLDLASTTPQVLQNFWDPVHQDHSVLEFCRENNIFFSSYSSLRPYVLAAPDDAEYSKVREVVKRIAAKHKVTPVQALLKQMVQQGIGVIPRSKSKAHLAENRDLWKFNLTQDEVDLLTVKRSVSLHDEL